MSQANPYVGRLSPDGRWRWDGERWLAVGPRAVPQWARVSRRRELNLRGLAAVIAVALLADQAARAGAFGLGATLTVLVAATWLAASRLVTNRQALTMLAAAALFGIGFTLRASPWVTWPDLAAAVGLLGVAASLAVRGSLLDLPVVELLVRTWNGCLHLLTAPALVAATRHRVGQRGRHAGAVARGLAIALPLGVLIAGLLAAADPIFASFFRLNLDVGALVIDCLLIAAFGWLMAALVSVASAPPLDRVEGPAWQLGDVEVLVVVGVLDAIFAAFAVAQVIGVSGAGAATLRASGTSYSEYARSGFFQLLAVASITLVALAAVAALSRRRGSRNQRLLTGLMEAAVLMTILVVYVASARLSLYEQAYGFAMLRLYSHIFALWLGVLFLLLGLTIAGVGRGRRWFFGAAIVTGLVILGALNLLNPEAAVVQLNVQRYQSTHKLDTAYLGQLSDDATPAIVGRLGRLDLSTRRSLVRSACAPTKHSPVWAAFNVSSVLADERRTECRAQ